MFTGVIEATATIRLNHGSRLALERPPSFNDVKVGSSIAVSGVCLTIIGFDSHTLSFDVTPETLEKSTLLQKKPGDHVNLERALPSDGRFDGHIVQGHVEGVGKVISHNAHQLTTHHSPLTTAAENLLVVQLPAEILSGIVSKGSIAIDGVSLTVASIEGGRVTIALIPETLRRTTLAGLHEGDRVNIETDILGRYVQDMMSNVQNPKS